MPTFQKSISSSSDDVSVWAWNLLSGVGPREHANREKLRAGVDGIEALASAMRFVSVDVPQGAIVDRARLRIYLLKDSQAGAAQFAAFAEDNSDRPRVDDLFGRSRQELTTARAVSGAYSKRDTPSIDVTDIIQEVVKRPGWKSGNSLTIAAIPGDGDGDLRWLSFAAEEHDKSAPRLTVDWSEAKTEWPTFDRPQPEPPKPQPEPPKPQPEPPKPQPGPTVWCAIYG